eukprot:12943329-Alexandrium_andersonii.AAC.1
MEWRGRWLVGVARVGQAVPPRRLQDTARPLGPGRPEVLGFKAGPHRCVDHIVGCSARRAVGSQPEA